MTASGRTETLLSCLSPNLAELTSLVTQLFRFGKPLSPKAERARAWVPTAS